MKLDNIFRAFEPVPTIIVLAVSLPFLIIGLVEGWKAGAMVRSSITTTGTVIDNEYWSSGNPEKSRNIHGSYHPVVRFTTAQGKQVVFTDMAGSYPPDFKVGAEVEVRYDPEAPEQAAINRWMSIWMGPVLFIAIGLLPILGFGGWSVWRYARAEREFQAARNARLR